MRRTCAYAVDRSADFQSAVSQASSLPASRGKAGTKLLHFWRGELREPNATFCPLTTMTTPPFIRLHSWNSCLSVAATPKRDKMGRFPHPVPFSIHWNHLRVFVPLWFLLGFLPAWLLRSPTESDKTEISGSRFSTPACPLSHFLTCARPHRAGKCCNKQGRNGSYLYEVTDVSQSERRHLIL